jgi:mono/diheme cytochrome c family protein
MFRKILRWLGIVFGGLAVLVLIAALVIYFRSQALVAQSYGAPDDPITVKNDAATLERGRYLVNYVSVCVDCHGDKLQGGVVVDDTALGRIVAPNLTTGKGGRGGQLTDADFVRVLRYGILSDGTSAKVMPSDDYQHLSDSDLAAIIAYVRSVPPQDSALPAATLGPLGRVLLVTGQLPILMAERVDPQTERAELIPGVSVEYGQYLANIAGCTGCHGPGLSGGPIPAAPPDWPLAANLTPSGDVGQWSEADFIKTIRTGLNPAGKALDVTMPWPRYGSMTDDDLKALWAFIQTVPAKPAGNR